LRRQSINTDAVAQAPTDLLRVRFDEDDAAASPPECIADRTANPTGPYDVKRTYLFIAGVVQGL
jgi:hypothetical protein